MMSLDDDVVEPAADRSRNASAFGLPKNTPTGPKNFHAMPPRFQEPASTGATFNGPTATGEYKQFALSYQALKSVQEATEEGSKGHIDVLGWDV